MLRCQLHTFGIHFHESLEKPAQEISIFDIKKYFMQLFPGQSSLLLTSAPEELPEDNNVPTAAEPSNDIAYPQRKN